MEEEEEFYKSRGSESVLPIKCEKRPFTCGYWEYRMFLSAQLLPPTKGKSPTKLVQLRRGDQSQDCTPHPVKKVGFRMSSVAVSLVCRSRYYERRRCFTFWQRTWILRGRTRDTECFCLPPVDSPTFALVYLRELVSTGFVWTKLYAQPGNS